MRWILLSVVAAGAVAAGVAAMAGGSSSPSCRSEVRHGVLPEWARTGFSEDEPRIAHVLGRRGELVAILFGDPLSAPPREDRSNKILWVAKRTPPPGRRMISPDVQTGHRAATTC